jgi:hypothetical protein
LHDLLPLACQLGPARIRIRILLESAQRLFFEPEIDFPQLGSTGGPDRMLNAFEYDCPTVFNEYLAPHRYQRFLQGRGHRFPFPSELPKAPSILVMIRSAHCTADAMRLSVLGLGRLSPRSSGVLRCRATRIPATMASTRLRPSSILNSPFVRFSLAPHFDPAQYLKTSRTARGGRVGRNEAEEVAAAVVVTAAMPGCRIGRRVGPSPVFWGKSGRTGSILSEECGTYLTNMERPAYLSDVCYTVLTSEV